MYHIRIIGTSKLTFSQHHFLCLSLHFCCQETLGNKSHWLALRERQATHKQKPCKQQEGTGRLMFLYCVICFRSPFSPSPFFPRALFCLCETATNPGGLRFPNSTHPYIPHCLIIPRQRGKPRVSAFLALTPFLSCLPMIFRSVKRIRG